MPRHAITSLVLIAASLAAPARALQTAGTPFGGGEETPTTPLVIPDLGSLPGLPALGPTSPRNTLVFSDRFSVAPPPSALPEGHVPPQLIDAVIPAAETGTGYPERIQYQLPTALSADGPEMPLVIAYHGFGASCASVAEQSAIDEWCLGFGWIYMAPTGLDDKLFGSPLAARHVEAAIDWMIEHHPVDTERIYLVGFSMGAGVVANLAARARDPGGHMFAGAVLVSGSYDWTVTYQFDPAIQPWLEHDLNFGGSPLTAGFTYQRHGVLVFPWPDPSTWTSPPLPDRSLARNLASLPVYVTWDVNDPIAGVATQSEQLVELLANLGGTVAARPRLGTPSPLGQPTGHSWLALDVGEAFGFLDGARVDRRPRSVDLVLDAPGPAAWLDVDPRSAGDFARLRARWTAPTPTDPGRVEVGDVGGARRVTIDLDVIPVGPAPRIVAGADDGAGFELGLDGSGWVRRHLDGSILPGVDYEPDLVIVPIPPHGSEDLTAHDADWNATLRAHPDPVERGHGLILELDGGGASEPTPSRALILVGLADDAFSIPGGWTLQVSPLPPTAALTVPLDAAGHITLGATVPDVDALSGLRILIQAILLDSSGKPSGTTNPIALLID